jgi:bacteriophage exclusion system BrxB-like protein
MPAFSLQDRMQWLERELPPNPPRFKIHDALPFAILRYDPSEEWDVRRETRRLAARLTNAGLRVEKVSLAELLWEAIDSCDGRAAIERLERTRGFDAAQAQVTRYLTDPELADVPTALARRLEAFQPASTICFLTRAASMGPGIYPMSVLLDQMHGRTRVPTILFYPGQFRDGTTLVYMGLAGRDAPGNYRVKIYG